MMFEGILASTLHQVCTKSPLLFTIYINNMFLNKDYSNSPTYAKDDSSALKGLEIARQNFYFKRLENNFLMLVKMTFID